MNEMEERSELLTISTSRAFQRILYTHKIFLQEEVNKFVRSQNLIEAYSVVKKMDDLDKIMTLVNQRLEDLKKEK